MSDVPRIDPLEYDDTNAEQREAWDKTVAGLGVITSMKRTLLHSPPAFRALMEWYPLRDAVEPFLGARRATIFCHAISAETDCLICSTYFRRTLIDSGEDPDALELDDLDQLVVDFGRCLAQPDYRVPDELYARIAAEFTDEQVVLLTAFGAVMVATNAFNNALEVQLDGFLDQYRPSESSRKV